MLRATPTARVTSRPPANATASLVSSRPNSPPDGSLGVVGSDHHPFEFASEANAHFDRDRTATVTLTLRFADGTLVVEGDAVPDHPLLYADDRSGVYRAPAQRYPAVRAALEAADPALEDRVFRGEGPGPLETSYELRSYQRAALDDWRDADARGVIELPTGSGKTVVAIAAIAERSVPTLVVVPTLDLLAQWVEELETEFDTPVGRLGGGDQRIEPVTVSTYDTMRLRADELGDRFRFVVFDEVHHLGGAGNREAAELLAAPARLGLTATFERPDGAHEAVADVVGPLVHSRDAEALAGEHLAPYDVKRIRVELTEGERAAYETAQGTFTDYLARSGLQLRSGADYRELVKRSGTDPDAREALLAKERARGIVMNASRKLEELAAILDRHREDRIIVFTARNELAYRIADRFLVPVITHQTGAEERQELLDRFREGSYSRIVSSNVLDEGIDVPDANVGVICSGSGSRREFTQRLGRLLRPKRDGGRALLYELVADETAEERVANRRR